VLEKVCLAWRTIVCSKNKKPLTGNTKVKLKSLKIIYVYIPVLLIPDAEVEGANDSLIVLGGAAAIPR
jgi:hypothetical protein